MFVRLDASRVDAENFPAFVHFDQPVVLIDLLCSFALGALLFGEACHLLTFQLNLFALRIYSHCV